MRSIKRHSRNSLHLLIDNELRRKCNSSSSNNNDNCYNESDDYNDVVGLWNKAKPKPAKKNVLFERVAFYENPGILMIIQSVEGGENLPEGFFFKLFHMAKVD